MGPSEAPGVGPCVMECEPWLGCMMIFMEKARGFSRDALPGGVTDVLHSYTGGCM